MKSLTMMFTLTLCLFAMVEMSSSQVYKRDITISINPLTRNLTRKEIRNLKPRSDGVPTGTVKPHPLTGKIKNKKPVIIGGRPAGTNQFPWSVAMLFNSAWFCGGSVISPLWVLTAGHCILGATRIDMFMGTVNWQISTGRVVFTSNVSFVPPNYTTPSITNDIGLVKLPNAINNTFISSGKIVPIRLPTLSQVNMTFVGTVMTVAGWGWIRDGVVSSSLNFVSMPVISNANCVAVYGLVVLSSMMCTSPGTPTFPTNICNGDSGSGLHSKQSDGRFTIFGVTSFNNQATCFGYPAGYTRVTSFLAWISSITNLLILP